MMKKLAGFIRENAVLILGGLFVLVAAPIIHRSGLDDTDSAPSPEDIEKANQFVEQLHGERSK